MDNKALKKQLIEAMRNGEDQDDLAKWLADTFNEATDEVRKEEQDLDDFIEEMVDLVSNGLDWECYGPEFRAAAETLFAVSQVKDDTTVEEAKEFYEQNLTLAKTTSRIFEKAQSDDGVSDKEIISGFLDILGDIIKSK